MSIRASPHRTDDSRRSAQFEVFLNGIEMANGYFELGDVNQRQRMQADLSERNDGLPQVPPDDPYWLSDPVLATWQGYGRAERLIAAMVDDLRDVLTFVPRRGANSPRARVIWRTTSATVSISTMQTVTHISDLNRQPGGKAQTKYS